MNQKDAQLALCVTEIGDCLSELGMVCAQGLKDDNHSARGRIAVRLEIIAARLRGDINPPHFLTDIEDFHNKFGLEYNGPVRNLDEETAGFRIGFLREEVNEFEEAVAAGDLAKALDALVDLDYVQKGTVHLMGMSRVYNEAWRRVHGANMQKRRAENADESKRGSKLDVVKPEGWQAPDHSDLVK